MPLIYQHRIYRSDLQKNHDLLYIFGDNLERFGLGGQAKEMRGEPNAVGVATKRAPGWRDEDFFTDDDYEANQREIIRDIYPLMVAHRAGVMIVMPSDGIGTGLSEMPERCPKTFGFLTGMLRLLTD